MWAVPPWQCCGSPLFCGKRAYSESSGQGLGLVACCTDPVRVVTACKYHSMTANPYLFFCGDVPLSARVHRATGDPLERQPAAKEQMADRYAQALAVHGHYIARLANGTITELTLEVFYQEGNLDLPAMATQRATTSPRR